jgi:hypothetical protein
MVQRSPQNPVLETILQKVMASLGKSLPDKAVMRSRLEELLLADELPTEDALRAILFAEDDIQ